MSEVALPADAPALTGSLVAGKYRVHDLIGSGGMGTVWRGVARHSAYLTARESALTAVSG